MLIDNHITVTVTVFFPGGFFASGYSHSYRSYSPGFRIVMIETRIVIQNTLPRIRIVLFS